MRAERFAPGYTASPRMPASMRSKAASTSNDICPTSLVRLARRNWKAPLRLTCPCLRPYPDANLEGFADAAPNPEARYSARESVQLAFVAAIQRLPPRQRAALMLCDVLGWASAEAATLLGGSTASINSALQRARETLSHRYSDRRPPFESQPTPSQQGLLGRYLQAWEGHDIDGFLAVLKEDATVVMPPWLQWFFCARDHRDFFCRGMEDLWWPPFDTHVREWAASLCDL